MLNLRHYCYLLVLMISAQPAYAEPAKCFAALQDLNGLVSKQVGYSYGLPIASQPQLRYDRYAHSFLAESFFAKSSSEQLADLVGYMQQLNLRGLANEWPRLSEQSQTQWLQRHQIDEGQSYIEQCHHALNQQALTQPDSLAQQLSKLREDRDYSGSAKFFGIYPLTVKAIEPSLHREQIHLRQLWREHQGRQAPAQAQLYSSTRQASVEFAWPALDSLGKPKLSEAEQQSLLQKHAPQWLLLADDQNNRLVEPQWQAGLLGSVPSNKLFSLISYGRHGEYSTVQLNYVFWFARRPKLSSPDWVAGEHDALVFRVHLDHQGEVLAYDSIHLCGCWYTLYLSQSSHHLLPQNKDAESLLVHWLPSYSPARLWVSADTHQIVKIESQARPLVDSITTTETHLVSWWQLYQLSQGSELSAAFDRQGMIVGSQRPERWLLWPMGVPKAGSLRQFGNHAIAFKGERHFDQPFLLNQLGLQAID